MGVVEGFCGGLCCDGWVVGVGVGRDLLGEDVLGLSA